MNDTGRSGRAVAGWITLVVAALLLLLTVFAVWVDRVALNTDVFVETSTELIEDKAIRDAVATRAVDELFGSVDVETEIEDQLPKDFKSLSGPATAGIRQASYELVDRALEQPLLQRLWALALRESHDTLVAVLERDGTRFTSEGGVVSLDLERIVLETADRIGIRARIEDKLPDDVGRIEILRSDELDTAQDAFQLLETLAWALPLLTLVAFAAVAGIESDRRRAVRRTGVTVVVVGVLGLVAARVVGDYLVDGLVSETQNRTAADSAWTILTELLRASFRWLVVAGLVFLLAAWLAGPGRRAFGVRRALAPVLRDRIWSYAALAVLALLLLVTSPVNDFVRVLVVAVWVALGIVWVEVMRAQTVREFPGLPGAALWADARALASGWWQTLRPIVSARPSPPPPAAEDLTSRLARLADLHARGELTDDEYSAAKARVLGGE